MLDAPPKATFTHEPPMSAIDLTGVWQGLYSYPAGPSVTFTATLIESASHLTGATFEGCSSPRCRVPSHEAFLNGTRRGSAIAFEKVYDPADDEFGAVHYNGMLNADGDEIEGRWSIPGLGSGKFLMIRSVKKATAKSRGKLVEV